MKNRITIVHNSLDVPEIEARETTFNPGRYSPPKILVLGGLDIAKGSEHLKYIISTCCDEITDLEVNIIGDGPLRLGLESELSKYPRVKFHGYLDGEKKFRLLRESTCVVSPGRIGLVAVESLSFGCPIVCRKGTLNGPEFSYLKNGHSMIEIDGDIEHYTRELIFELRHQNNLRQIATTAYSQRNLHSLARMVQSFSQGVLDCLAS